MSKKCCAAEKLSSRSSPLCQLKKCREGDLHFLVWSQDCQLKKCRLISTCLASGRRNCLVSCCGTCRVQSLVFVSYGKWKLSHLLWNLTCQLPFTLTKIGYIDWNLSLFLWIPFGVKELHCTSEFFHELFYNYLLLICISFKYLN